MHDVKPEKQYLKNIITTERSIEKTAYINLLYFALNVEQDTAYTTFFRSEIYRIR